MLSVCPLLFSPGGQFNYEGDKHIQLKLTKKAFQKI